MAPRGAVVGESLPMFSSSARTDFAGLSRLCILFLAAMLASPMVGDSRGAAAGANHRGVAIVQHGGYPELLVDGKPFFIHSGAFFYDRVPRDLWERTLDRYRELGINTVDIYIPWNWHEPREGEFDFDGHTNPRRDLRALLRLIAERNFRLIARPGPQILNEWRHGGYPGWLLERPEYHMDPVDRLEGRYPPFSYRNTSSAEDAASDLLANATHMEYTRKWLEAVAKELAPYSASRVVPVPQPESEKRRTRDVPGPVLFVQLEDDLAIGRTNRTGQNFWRYLRELRAMLESGGLDVPVFINPADMRISAEGAGLAQPIGVMGQWYMPQGEKETGERSFDAADAATVEFAVEELKTQPAFPPALIEFQAGWYCPADDDRPLESPPSNTLLASRLAIGHGLHGLNYFPLQDTVTPAGESVPWANRAYRWDAALSPDGELQPRARAVSRNDRLLQQWGEWLASSHQRADFGIVYPLGAFPQDGLTRANVLRVSRTVQQVERLAQLGTLSSELVDPEYQPVEQLLRYAVLLLPTFDVNLPQFQLSEKAQGALVEYVRRGGALVVFSSRPAGKLLDQLWSAPAQAGPGGPSAISQVNKFGSGQVIESTKDFFSWVVPEKEFGENLAHEEAAWATGVLSEFLRAAEVQPIIRRSGRGEHSPELILTELVSNEGTGPLGARISGTGLLSVTNLSDDTPAEEEIEALAPGVSSRGQGGYLPVRLNVPPRESLLLPLAQPLCSAASPYANCRDAVTSAGAELLHAEREGKTLELTFYTPARSTIVVKLAKQPSHIKLNEETSLRGVWNKSDHHITINLPRGPSPSFLRVLRISLPYEPFVPEAPRPQSGAKGNYSYSFVNALRLPLGESASLASEPPLMVINAESPGHLIVQAEQSGAEWPRLIRWKVDGPIRGSAGAEIPKNGSALAAMKLRSSTGKDAIPAELAPAVDGLVHGTVEIRSENDRAELPILFAVMRQGAVSHYQFDFDRDGAPEWVLENAGMRLILSPESGGRAVALVEKKLGLDLISSVGALRDNFACAENPAGINTERARGRFGLFNRSYQAEWLEEEGSPALRLRYDAPDVYPAGASIEKIVRLAGLGEVRADYRVRLLVPGSASAAAQEPQAFVAVNSLPASARINRSTQFCWAAPSSPPAEGAGDGMHCESFMPGGAALTLPAGAHKLEVRTPGQPRPALEWSCADAPAVACGQMTVEMKNYSALLKLQFPALSPGGTPGEYSVRYVILPIEETPVR
jgi:Glycosyl hydrolases family 35